MRGSVDLGMGVSNTSSVVAVCAIPPRSHHPTRLFRLCRCCCRYRLNISWYCNGSADLSCISSILRSFACGWDTLSFSMYTHSMGTLCFPVKCLSCWVAYTCPWNFGFRKSGALRLRDDRLNASVPSGEPSIACGGRSSTTAGGAGMDGIWPSLMGSSGRLLVGVGSSHRCGK